jgi:WD40 repeat protein
MFVCYGVIYVVCIPVRLYCVIVLSRTVLSHVSSFENKRSVLTLVFSEADNRLICGSDDKIITVWDTVSKTCITTIVFLV